MKLNRNDFLTILGILVLWAFWLSAPTFYELVGPYYKIIDRIFLISLFLIVITPLFFAKLLNFRRGIIIGFFGSFIPIFTNFLYYSISIDDCGIIFLIMILSILSILIDENTRQEGLKEIKSLYTKKSIYIQNFYKKSIDFTREHPLLTALIISITGSLTVYLLTN